jgi:F-type H+-transporting ATPase subunit gamma
MAGLSEIRHHIAAVEQTRKITGAMELVSSTRMKRVLSHIEQNRRYFDSVRRTMKEILANSEGVRHPYLREVPEGGNCTFIVIAGDKGLCGAYNHNVLQLATENIVSHPSSSIITIGNVAEDFFHSRGMQPDMTFLGIAQDPALSRARALSRDIIQLFDKGLTDELRIVYTSFYGDTKNKPLVQRLLPVQLQDFSDISDIETRLGILYHPSPEAVFDLLIPQYVLGIIFGVMVQAYASEYFARMSAMHSATTNAQDMLKRLRARYNMARQSAITNETAEITGAAETLTKGDL